MNLHLAWNELAEIPLAASKQEAIERMNGFVDMFAALLIRVRSYVSKPTLRYRASLDGVELAEDYRVANWRTDTDRTHRMLFLAIVTASPFFPTIQEGGNAEQYASEASVAGRRAEGLHSAWMWGGVGLSLASEERWRFSHVDLEVGILDASDHIARTVQAVRHASIRDHILKHVPWFEEQARLTIADASDLWLRRTELFPHLEFCKEMEAGLSRFDVGAPHLRQVVNRLFELDRAFEAWDGTTIGPQFVASKCTPETPQTLKEEADAHTATRSSGEKRLFSWHIRFTPGAGRVFFDGDSPSKRGIVGLVVLKKGYKLS